MDTIGKQELWSILEGDTKARPADCTKVRKGHGYQVTSYLELATRVAELQFKNREYVLLFRGQNADHLNHQKNTSLKPSLFRQANGPDYWSQTLADRFTRLELAEGLLVELYEQQGFPDLTRLKRQKLLRWSILQHYEVCDTPLLDVTQSLRIAASFASDGCVNDAYVFVVGVPNLSGAISASAEAGLQTVRLASVCPPTALRPHVQEGYLLGEYPEMTGYNQKQHYKDYEVDFGRRLVAKFRFQPASFWKRDAFPKVGIAARYPDKNDPLYQLTQSVKKQLNNNS